MAVALTACGGGGSAPAETPAAPQAAPRALVADFNRTAFGGQTVTLHAYAPGTPEAKFEWSQISGTKVTLQNAETASPSFVAPEPRGSNETLAFKLTVSNSAGVSQVEKITVFVQPAGNLVVTASTKLAKAIAGNTVSLHASGVGASSPTYQWTQVAPSSPVATLSQATTANPSFVAPNADNVTFRFQVRYQDTASGRVATDEVDVLVRRASAGSTLEPLSVAGSTVQPRQTLTLAATPDATVAPGGSVNVTLAATGGTQPYAWAWTQTGGTAAAMAGQSGPLLRVTAPAGAAAGALTFQARVTDAAGRTLTGTARVRVVPLPSSTTPPVAVAAPVPVYSVTATAGSAISVTTAVRSPVVVQTGGSVSTIATRAATTPGSTVITVTPPLIAASTEHAEFTITGTNASGQPAQEKIALVILRAPSVAPPTVAPPVVGVTAPTLLQPLALTSCGQARADEGQAGVVLGVCATGGAGNYVYSWAYEPTTGVPTVVLRDTGTSHPSLDVPGVTGPTILKFNATVRDGQLSASTRVYLVVNDLSSSVVVATVNDVTVESGHMVSLSPPQVRGGVPPYAWAVTQTAGPSVGTLRGSNPSFPAPVLAAGSANQTLSFEYTLTDGYGNQAKVIENVVVKAPALPLGASLAGPSAGDQGTSVTLHANAVGGVPPYSYRYTVTGATVAIPTNANPAFTLPAIAAGGRDLTLGVTVQVTDSSAPVKTVTSSALQLVVSAPPPPPAQPSGGASGPATAEAKAADATVSSLFTGATSNPAPASVLSAAVAAAANLPDSVKTAGVPSGAKPADDPSCEITLPRSPQTGLAMCVDTYIGICNDDFGRDVIQQICVAAQLCAKSGGYCSGVTPDMARLMERSTERAVACATANISPCPPPDQPLP